MNQDEKRKWIEAELRMHPNSVVIRSMYLALRWVNDGVDLPPNMLAEIVTGTAGCNGPASLP